MDGMGINRYDLPARTGAFPMWSWTLDYLQICKTEVAWKKTPYRTWCGKTLMPNCVQVISTSSTNKTNMEAKPTLVAAGYDADASGHKGAEENYEQHEKYPPTYHGWILKLMDQKFKLTLASWTKKNWASLHRHISAPKMERSGVIAMEILFTPPQDQKKLSKLKHDLLSRIWFAQYEKNLKHFWCRRKFWGQRWPKAIDPILPACFWRMEGLPTITLPETNSSQLNCWGPPKKEGFFYWNTIIFRGAKNGFRDSNVHGLLLSVSFWAGIYFFIFFSIFPGISE